MSEQELINMLLNHDCFIDEVAVTKTQIIGQLNTAPLTSAFLAYLITWGFEFHASDKQIRFFKRNNKQ